MKPAYRTIPALITLAVLVTSGASAQGNVTTSISGRVTGADGAGLPGVTVTFESLNLRGSRVVRTEANGNYASPLLPPGMYFVAFELGGFPSRVEQVQISADSTVSLNVDLESADASSMFQLETGGEECPPWPREPCWWCVCPNNQLIFRGEATGSTCDQAKNAAEAQARVAALAYCCGQGVHTTCGWRAPILEKSCQQTGPSQWKGVFRSWTGCPDTCDYDPTNPPEECAD